MAYRVLRSMILASRSADCRTIASEWSRAVRRFRYPKKVKKIAVLAITQTASFAASPSRNLPGSFMSPRGSLLRTRRSGVQRYIDKDLKL